VLLLEVEDSSLAWLPVRGASEALRLGLWAVLVGIAVVIEHPRQALEARLIAVVNELVVISPGAEALPNNHERTVVGAEVDVPLEFGDVRPRDRLGNSRSLRWRERLDPLRRPNGKLAPHGAVRIR